MRWIRLSLKIIAVAVGLVLLVFGGLAIYVNSHKDTILKAITAELEDNINGTLEIGRMRSSFLRGFPGVSISLTDVTLRDSLWQVHHHTLLDAKEVYVSVNALSIFSGNILIRDITIGKAKIYIFTDSLDYSNTDIFRKKKDTTGKKKELPRINHFYFNDVELVLEHQAKFKLYQFEIKKLETVLDYTSNGWDGRVYLKTQVKNMMFNTEKGSFLKNKLLVLDMKMAYDSKTETLEIPWNKIKINNDEVQVLGKFVFSERPAAFELFFKADGIMYKNVLSFLTPAISGKIDKFDFARPVDVQAILRGRAKYRDTPNVVLKWQIRNNSFSTPGGPIEKCSFKGSFLNERVVGAGHRDDNSRIAIEDMSGEWGGIAFRADTVTVTNLENPVLEGRFTSKFDVTKLNPIIGGNTFQFDKGNVNVNVLYKGGLRSNDTLYPYIFGYVQLTNAAMTYIPRGMTFYNSSATMRFVGSDLFIDKVKIQRGTTILNMDGSLLNFLNLYYTAPDKILLDWRVQSDMIDLNEFIPFLAVRKKQKAAPVAGKTAHLSDQLDKMLDASSVHMHVNVARVKYRKFEGELLSGDLSMASNGISMKGLSVNHADGKVKLDAQVDQNGAVNEYALKASVERVNVKKFFSAFENFGQDAITDKNINGNLSAGINVTGGITDNGKLVPRAINGTVSFKFEKGTLIDFEPFRAIGALVFRKRRMDSIAFRDIDNKFNVRGNKIFIYPLFIESNVLNIKAQGVYAIGSAGTDINLDIPLRNPEKDELVFNDELRHERNMKGIVLHLKAADGDDGKVKIRLNMKNTPVAAMPDQGPPEAQKHDARKK